jgi:hypothetical protein
LQLCAPNNCALACRGFETYIWVMAATTTPTPSRGGPGIVATSMARAKTYGAPYYIAVAAALGGITVVFVIVILLLVMVTLNFNLLALIE